MVNAVVIFSLQNSKCVVKKTVGCTSSREQHMELVSDSLFDALSTRQRHPMLKED